MYYADKIKQWRGVKAASSISHAVALALAGYVTVTVDRSSNKVAASHGKAYFNHATSSIAADVIAQRSSTYSQGNVEKFGGD